MWLGELKKMFVLVGKKLERSSFLRKPEAMQEIRALLIGKDRTDANVYGKNRETDDALMFGKYNMLNRLEFLSPNYELISNGKC